MNVDVVIPVDAATAAALTDERTRAAIGRLISRVLRPPAELSALAVALAELQAEARVSGLTDAIVDAELDAYNAERRNASPA